MSSLQKLELSTAKGARVFIGARKIHFLGNGVSADSVRTANTLHVWPRLLSAYGTHGLWLACIEYNTPAFLTVCMESSQVRLGVEGSQVELGIQNFMVTFLKSGFTFLDWCTQNTIFLVAHIRGAFKNYLADFFR